LRFKTIAILSRRQLTHAIRWSDFSPILQGPVQIQPVVSSGPSSRKRAALWQRRCLSQSLRNKPKRGSLLSISEPFVHPYPATAVQPPYQSPYSTPSDASSPSAAGSSFPSGSSPSFPLSVQPSVCLYLRVVGSASHASKSKLG